MGSNGREKVINWHYGRRQELAMLDGDKNSDSIDDRLDHSGLAFR